MEISPRWSNTAKGIVMLGTLAVLGYLLVRFRDMVPALIMAVILAYLFNPLAARMVRRLRLPRPLAVLIIYTVLVLILIALLSGAGLLIQQQFSGVLSTALTFINSIPGWLETLSAEPVQLGPFTLDLTETDVTALQNALIPTARDSISRMADLVTSAASSVAIFLAWTMFVLVISFYLLNDLFALEGTLLRLTPPDFRRDVQRLLGELGPIWNAFLRGQVILSLVMGTLFGVVMSALGLRYAIIIALIAMLMEFIPILGPYVTGGTAVIIAIFQTGNWLGIPAGTYPVVILAAAGVLMLLESQVIGPRIMSLHLRLNPAALILAALVGVSLAGISGLLLAGPILATLRLFGHYVYAKLFDLPPWPDLEEHPPAVVEEHIIRCRPARPEDKIGALAISARIWEGRDYIPRVWDRWLADTAGRLAVADYSGFTAGLGKLTSLGNDEWWVEGVRVHPDFQGRKIGSHLFEYLVGEWQQHGSGVLRLATSSERVQIHHLCGRMGFTRLAVMDVLSASTRTDGRTKFEPMAEEEAAEAAGLPERGAPDWSADGLINIGWQWSRLTPERIAAIARRGRAWWWAEKSAALLLCDFDNDGRADLEIAAILCPPKQLPAMLREARVLAGRLGAAQLTWTAPELPAVTAAARRAGFTPDWNAKLWLFEHR